MPKKSNTEKLEKLRRLRADIDQGLGSLRGGRGREFNIEEFIDRKNRQNGRNSSS